LAIRSQKTTKNDVTKKPKMVAKQNNKKRGGGRATALCCTHTQLTQRTRQDKHTHTHTHTHRKAGPTTFSAGIKQITQRGATHRQTSRDLLIRKRRCFSFGRMKGNGGAD
jgi:hypothetical protein